jgi:hypothetical protein
MQYKLFPDGLDRRESVRFTRNDKEGSDALIFSALRKNLVSAAFCGFFEILAVRVHFFHEGERLDEDTGLAWV